jgi:hypothetical protein
MSYDTMSLGSVPAYEDCAQVGRPGYWERSLEEAKRYIVQLNAMFHPLIVQLNVQGWFTAVTEQDDQGNDKKDVVFKFNEDREINGMFSIFVENHMPCNWADDHVYTREEFEAWRNE